MASSTMTHIRAARYYAAYLLVLHVLHARVYV